MRIPAIVAVSCIVALSLWTSASWAGTATIAGLAFVDTSVTSRGSKAHLPAGTKIYPPDSKITGTEGCKKIAVAVVDYEGEQTAGSATVTRHPASGGDFVDAPYYLYINSGRTLQQLSAISPNGSFDVRFSYNLGQSDDKTISAKFVLDRSCKH